MLNQRRNPGGFLLVELIVAIALLGLILAGLGLTVAGLGRFNRYEWARQQCLAAAQAQLDSLAATGEPLGVEDIERLWPDVTLTTDRLAGEGQWDGLELVQVAATMSTHPRPADVRLARYVRPAGRDREGGLAP